MFLAVSVWLDTTRKQSVPHCCNIVSPSHSSSDTPPHIPHLLYILNLKHPLGHKVTASTYCSLSVFLSITTQVKNKTKCPQKPKDWVNRYPSLTHWQRMKNSKTEKNNNEKQNFTSAITTLYYVFSIGGSPVCFYIAPLKTQNSGYWNFSRFSKNLPLSGSAISTDHNSSYIPWVISTSLKLHTTLPGWKVNPKRGEDYQTVHSVLLVLMENVALLSPHALNSTHTN